MTADVIDALQQIRESEIRRGLRAVTQDLNEVAREFYAMGEDALADHAHTICRMVEDLTVTTTGESR